MLKGLRDALVMALAAEADKKLLGGKRRLVTGVTLARARGVDLREHGKEVLFAEVDHYLAESLGIDELKDLAPVVPQEQMHIASMFAPAERPDVAAKKTVFRIRFW
jgi:hypothetical protein